MGRGCGAVLLNRVYGDVCPRQAGRQVRVQHSCGAIRTVPRPDRHGVDTLTPFSPKLWMLISASESGHHLTFYGGISTQQVLPRVSPASCVVIKRMIALVGKMEVT